MQKNDNYYSEKVSNKVKRGYVKKITKYSEFLAHALQYIRAVKSGNND
jgi:hypothetical protein